VAHPKAPPVVDIDRAAVEQTLDRAKAVLLPPDFDLIRLIVDSYLSLVDLVRRQRTTLARLRSFVGVSTSEKLAGVAGKGEPSGEPPKPSPDAALPAGADASAPPEVGGEAPPVADEAGAAAGTGAGEAAAGASKPAEDAEGKAKQKVKGHGRVPASAYRAAQHIAVPHASLRVGACCPGGCPGKLYQLRQPATILRIFGQAPLSAICWDCDELRCSACNKVYTARAPEEAQGEKYDETAASMMAVLTYGTGTAFNCVERLQRDCETPVPASTQWDVVNARVPMIQPVYDELERIAAQGSVLHVDDSHKGILELKGKRRDALVDKGVLSNPERTGLFTTAIVSVADTRPVIVLFFTGRNHAGENLGTLLDKRDAGLFLPILMSDALARNVPENHAVVESNCLTHARRKIHDEHRNYPVLCRALLEKVAR
jgi:hypothetical protein